MTGLVEEPSDNTYNYFSHVLQNKSATGKPDAKARSLATKKNQAMNGVLEMDKKMDAMLLGFKEINSTIDKYINNIESDDEKEFVPRKKKCMTTISKHQPLTLRESQLPRNQMGYMTLVQRQELEHSKTQSIYFYWKKSNTIFVVPNRNIM